MTQNPIKNFWDNQSQSLHRDTDSLFYEKKANEHLGIFSAHEKTYPALDIGCGAGELLSQLIQKLDVRSACDISSSMLDQAKTKICNSSLKFSQETDLGAFLSCSHEALWMTTGAINQYLDAKELKKTLNIFAENKNARLFTLFDCVEPYKYRLLIDKISYLPARKTRKSSASMILKYLPRFILRNIRFLYYYVKISCSGCCVYLGRASMGYGYKTYIWHKWCEELNLSCEIVSSRYYEYRYHVIIKKFDSSSL
jgi:SAM-dependent methyltransferase